MKSWPFIIAIIMLTGAWSLLETVSQGEARVEKKPFAGFPLTLAKKWQGQELELEENVLRKLRLTDYLMRVYVPIPSPGGVGRVASHGRETGSPDVDGVSASPVWLYIAYYQSQRTGSTYHSPKNCFPGAGWQFVSSDYVSVPVPGAAKITINKVVIQKGLDRQLILYWYHDRGRVIASEYWAKGFMIWDAMTRNRTDGALVRISIPVTQGVERAFQDGLRFLRDVWPVLLDFMPDRDVGTA